MGIVTHTRGMVDQSGIRHCYGSLQDHRRLQCAAARLPAQVSLPQARPSLGNDRQKLFEVGMQQGIDLRQLFFLLSLRRDVEHF